MNILKQFALDAMVVIGIPAIIVAVYYTIMGPEAALLLSSDGVPQVELSADGTEELGARSQTLLGQLNEIHFDDSVFSDPVFWSLKDFSKPVATTTLGRRYPFTPSDEVIELLRKSQQPASSVTSAAPSTATSSPTSPKKR